MYFSSRFIRKRSKSLLTASDFESHCTWYAKFQRKYEFVYLPIASPVDRLINRSKAHQSVVISVSHYIVRPHAQKQRDEESARRTSTAQKVSDRVRKNQAVAAVKKKIGAWCIRRYISKNEWTPTCRSVRRKANVQSRSSNSVSKKSLVSSM